MYKVKKQWKDEKGYFRVFSAIIDISIIQEGRVISSK